MTRRVLLHKNTKGADGVWRKTEDGVATFHCFGLAYEEFASGTATYSVAIVELDNGVVEEYPTNMIRFLDPLSPNQSRLPLNETLL